METYAKILSMVIPGFVILIIIESIAARIMGRKVNRAMDTISSLSSGMTNTLKSIMGLSIVIISYEYMFDTLHIFTIKSTIWLYVIAFIGIDFAGYWSHRFNHVINIFWNRHVVHHSSEEFNLSCALRQSIANVVGIYFFLLLPLAVIGIPPIVVIITSPIHLFAQFWYHTRLINRMGFLEHIIVTPSHHRVHHAINPEYIDKNYSTIFILWDKWFGTFQEELPDVPPVYGTVKPANTWNPILINYLHAWQIIKDAWRTEKWSDKAKIWFMPTGWRPEDVKEKYPIHIEKDVYKRTKYDQNPSTFLRNWSWVQLIVHNLLMYYILIQIGSFEFIYIVFYASFLMVSIFAYTTMMDKHVFAVPAEIIKFITGLGLMYYMRGWFNIDVVLFDGATIMVAVYFIFSMALTVYFSYFEKTEDTNANLSLG